MVELNRRKLITGLISFAVAPAIVKYSSLMPVKVVSYSNPEETFIKLIEYCQKEMDQVTGITEFTRSYITAGGYIILKELSKEEVYIKWPYRPNN